MASEKDPQHQPEQEDNDDEDKWMEWDELVGNNEPDPDDEPDYEMDWGYLEDVEPPH